MPVDEEEVSDEDGEDDESYEEEIEGSNHINIDDILNSELDSNIMVRQSSIGV